MAVEERRPQRISERYSKINYLAVHILREQNGNETLATHATDNISFCQFD